MFPTCRLAGGCQRDVVTSRRSERNGSFNREEDQAHRSGLQRCLQSLHRQTFGASGVAQQMLLGGCVAARKTRRRDNGGWQHLSTAEKQDSEEAKVRCTPSLARGGRLEESIVEESIARGQPKLIFSSSEDAPVDAGQQSESDADCTDDDMIDPLHPLITMLHNLNFEPMLSLQEPRGYAPFSGLRQGFLNKRKDAAITATAKGPVASGNSYSLRRQIAALDEKMTAVRNENTVLREKKELAEQKIADTEKLNADILKAYDASKELLEDDRREKPMDLPRLFFKGSKGLR